MDEKQKRNVLSALSLTKHWTYLLTASMLTLAPMGAAAGNVESKSENTVQAVQQAKKTVTGRVLDPSGDPVIGATAPDGNTYTNNFGIKGLYFDSVIDGTIAIDYEKKTVKIGIMFDCREGQATGDATRKYCMYLPEGSGGNGWGNYNFQPKDFSTTKYDWLWLKLGSDNRSLKYQYFGEGQKMGAYYVCGISIVASSSPEASSFTATYDNIYQANYNGSNSESMYFLKN